MTEETRLPGGAQLVDTERQEVQFWVAQGKIRIGEAEAVITFVKSVNAPRNGDYLPSRVMVGGETRWSFEEESAKGFKGLVKLLEVDGEYVLVFERKLNGGEKIHTFEIERIMLLRDVVSRIPVLEGEEVRLLEAPTSTTVKLKEAISKRLGIVCLYTVAESEFISKRNEFRKRKEKERQEALAKQIREREELQRVEKEKREQERAARLAEIRGRHEVLVFDSKGEIRRGVPVLEEEWASCYSRTRCILFSERDADGKWKGPRELFYVEKLHSVCKKKVVLGELFSERPLPKEKAVESLGRLLFEIELDLVEVEVFSPEGFLELKNLGADGGRFVAIEKNDGYNIWRLMGKEPAKLVGSFKPVVI